MICVKTKARAQQCDQLDRDLRSAVTRRRKSRHCIACQAGGDAGKKFPCSTYDIGEAGKCYALERSTASAFHPIRTLEVGIRALSRCLQIPDPTKAHERNWGKLLNGLQIATACRTTASFFDNAYAALAAMQNPWRNATMHLDQQYTQEEARNILEIVRGFMRRLASRMDEDGKSFA
jgi:hypothetical protein